MENIKLNQPTTLDRALELLGDQKKTSSLGGMIKTKYHLISHSDGKFSVAKRISILGLFTIYLGSGRSGDHSKVGINRAINDNNVITCLSAENLSQKQEAVVQKIEVAINRLAPWLGPNNLKNTFENAKSERPNLLENYQNASHNAAKRNWNLMNKLYDRQRELTEQVNRSFNAFEIPPKIEGDLGNLKTQIRHIHDMLHRHVEGRNSGYVSDEATLERNEQGTTSAEKEFDRIAGEISRALEKKGRENRDLQV